MRVAFSSMVWNTGFRSPSEREITCNTSDVAACRSRASASSRVSALTSSCRLATTVELAGCASVSASLRLGFILLVCCAFAGSRLIVRCRLSEPFLSTNDHTLPHHEVHCAGYAKPGRGCPSRVAVFGTISICVRFSLTCRRLRSRGGSRGCPISRNRPAAETDIGTLVFMSTRLVLSSSLRKQCESWDDRNRNSKRY